MPRCKRRLLPHACRPLRSRDACATSSCRADRATPSNASHRIAATLTSPSISHPRSRLPVQHRNSGCANGKTLVSADQLWRARASRACPASDRQPQQKSVRTSSSLPGASGERFNPSKSMPKPLRAARVGSYLRRCKASCTQGSYNLAMPSASGAVSHGCSIAAHLGLAKDALQLPTRVQPTILDTCSPTKPSTDGPDPPCTTQEPVSSSRSRRGLDPTKLHAELAACSRKGIHDVSSVYGATDARGACPSPTDIAAHQAERLKR